MQNIAVFPTPAGACLVGAAAALQNRCSQGWANAVGMAQPAAMAMVVGMAAPRLAWVLALLAPWAPMAAVAQAQAGILMAEALA
jgi:hypothetical protein